MTKISAPYLLVILSLFLLMTITKAVSEEFYYDVSMTQLIATPERYIGKRIRVIGYFSKDVDTLYLSEDHAEISDYKSGIYISGPRAISDQLGLYPA